MPRENVEVVRQVVEAWNGRDLDRFLEVCDPEVEWHPALAPSFEGSEVLYCGHEGVERAWRGVWGGWEEFHLTISDTRAVGDRVLILGGIRARGKTSGAALESPWASVVEVRNAKLVAMADWLDHAPALETLGLRK